MGEGSERRAGVGGVSTVRDAIAGVTRSDPAQAELAVVQSWLAEHDLP